MHEVDANGLTEKQFLEQYKPKNYPRPSVTTDIAIFTVLCTEETGSGQPPKTELCILLIRRGGHPCIGQWALPGGFVNPDETVGEAASRELLEETGISGGYLEQTCVFSKPGRDPRMWIISCAHMALINGDEVMLKPGSDAKDAAWFKINFICQSKNNVFKLELSNGEVQLSALITMPLNNNEPEISDNNGLAFDHAKIIACAILKLRKKAKHKNLFLDMVSDKFAPSKINEVYNAILGKSLDLDASQGKDRSLV